MRPISRLLGVLAGVALAMAGAVPASAAVTDFLGKVVAAVNVDIEGRPTTDPAMLNVIETHVGAPLSMVEARESVTHLFSLGRFEDVRLHAEPSSAGVALRYELVPIHHVARIELRGSLEGIDKGRLRRAIVDRFGTSPAVGRADEVATLVAETLRQSGYLHPAVTPEVTVEHQPERATLIFRIEPRAKTVIGTVDVAGLPDTSVADLLGRLKLARGRPYEREAIQERIERYIQGQRSRGFYEAKVVPAVQLADGDRLANLTLTVSTGPRVRVVFTGDSLPGDRRDDLVPVQREGSIDEDLLEDSSHGIEEFLRGEGYRDARAPHTREVQNGDLVITFTVHRGPQYRVDTVEVSGNASVPLATIAPLLRVREHQPFVASNVDADVAAIENLYRREGFTAVRVQAGVDPRPADADAAIVPVGVRLAVREGVRTLVGSVRVEGNASVPAATLESTLGLQAGRPFFAPQMAADRDAIQSRHADLGFQNATIDVKPGLTPDGTRANVVFTVHEGPRLFVDHVLIIGNVRTSTATIQRELQLKPGDPIGTSAVNESQRRLAALGLFRRIRIAELPHGAENARDLIVTVEESPATTLSYGGGFEVQSLPTGPGTQQLDFAPRASFSIGRRNLFGKNRSVDLFSSVSLRPTDPTKPDLGYGFVEYRVISTFREPRVFNTTADAYLTGTVEQQRRASFDFLRRSATVALGRRLTRALSFTGSYQIQSVKLFDTRYTTADTLNPVLIDRLFPQVRLSFFSGSAIHDTRDDPVDPGSGRYVSVNGEFAGRAIGSEVGFAKSFLTAQAFKRLPGSRRIVLAGNARLGLASGFPRPVAGADQFGNPTVTEVKDLPASERFFAGGDTTVRGFALDTLGAPDTIKDGLPIGGNALVIFNAEARVQVRGGFGVVGFIDTGNVFASATDLSLAELRNAAGLGIRYKSPVGPIRFDVGFKLHRLPVGDGRLEPRSQIWISLGQAF